MNCPTGSWILTVLLHDVRENKAEFKLRDLQKCDMESV